MKTLGIMIKRNIKLFFKDKGMFFTSLITPLILLVLYVSFLGNVYRDSFIMNMPDILLKNEEFVKVIDGLVASQLASSLLAVCCITVAFCSNMLMVQDKVNGAYQDLLIAPAKKTTLSLAYFISTFISTLIICMIAGGCCLGYMATVGWYMSVSDVFLLLLDIIILVTFGTVLSSIIGYFLTSQGQISAVGTIISSCYGFICGAYMPISSFSEGLQKVISFLPGTYGTALLRNHAMQGAFKELERLGLPKESIIDFKNGVDCNIYFFDKQVPVSTMFVILIGTVIALIMIYVLINLIKTKKSEKA
ncbi:MAG: ABC transporter permease [Bacilli bacterium]|nr:ABC transporter permease [Bacilli bacterium]